MGLWEMKFLQLLKVLGESLKFQQGKQRILWSPQSSLLSVLHSQSYSADAGLIFCSSWILSKVSFVLLVVVLKKRTEMTLIPYGKAGSNDIHVKPVALLSPRIHETRAGLAEVGRTDEKGRGCAVSYVMQQNRRQGNRRSNVLTSLVSLFFRTPGTLKMSKYHMEREKKQF